MKTIWKSLVQPKLDYCSQFWSPGDQDSINRIESVQKHFVYQIAGSDRENYWSLLEKYCLNSQERRRERYLIIFLWKISQGLVNGYSKDFSSVFGRRGRLAVPNVVVNSSTAAVRRARESSIGVKGVQIFNLLPIDIRNIDSANVETFKRSLDTFLSSIPDQPTVPGQGRAAETNSLLHQIPLFMLNN